MLERRGHVDQVQGKNGLTGWADETVINVKMVTHYGQGPCSFPLGHTAGGDKGRSNLDAQYSRTPDPAV